MGKIGVVGGCAEYTGAPFFAAMSALKLGCDLSHVFCAENAGIPIKSYSPDLIVHPYFQENTMISQAVVDKFTSWLPRLTSLVVGPGLGQDAFMTSATIPVIHAARAANLPIIIDGDAITLVCREPSLIAGYAHAAITPNFNEFKRLIEALLPGGNADPADPRTLTALYGRLEGPVIIQKGETDRIVDSEGIVEVCTEGSPRRCGGQGDLLAGMSGVFVHWARATNTPRPILRGVQCAAIVTRHCSRRTFAKFGRAMTAQDMISEVPKALEDSMMEALYPSVVNYGR